MATVMDDMVDVVVTQQNINAELVNLLRLQKEKSKLQLKMATEKNTKLYDVNPLLVEFADEEIAESLKKLEKEYAVLAESIELIKTYM